MKRFVLLFLLAILSSPFVAIAQSGDKVTGAMVVTTTETIVKEPIVVPKEAPVTTNTKPKFTMMGQVGFFVPWSLGFDFHFLAGWTFKDRFFIGAGVGLDFDFESPSIVAAPLYANSRIYFTKHTKFRPFLDLSVGGNIPWGAYINVSIGAEVPVSKRLSLYAKAGYEAMHYEYLDYYYYRNYYGGGYYDYIWDIEMSHNFGFKVGLKF
ncbi:MAG: hypothetical protein E7140_00035 [Rikenellaceae bacterium]|nr:hypothetical protein [Rikenellaceae bacterium]